jgi:hypothetical protein
MRWISQYSLNAAIAVALLFSSAFAPKVADAAPPRVEGFSCSYGKAPRGTWIGYFDGIKESPIISFGERYDPVTMIRCFKTQADCKAWKYWAQTDYPTAVRTAWCRKK